MRRFKTNILIRDKRLKQMQQNGINVNYEILAQEKYLDELKLKLVEEATECLNTPLTEKDELSKELADVLEVINYLIKAAGLNPAEILAYKKQKHEKLGGFDLKIKTHFVEIDENNKPELDYYLKYPDKYPCINK